MMQRTIPFAALTVCLLGPAGTAQAQPAPMLRERAAVQINAGFQTGSNDFTDVRTPTIYDEPARFERRYDFQGGFLFDISGSVRVWEDVSIGVGFSAFADSHDGSVEATIPHPLFFDVPRAVSVPSGEVDHRQRSIYVMGIYTIPVDDRLDVAVFLGPSFFNVKQDVIGDVSIQETGAPFSTVNLTFATTELEDTAVGVIVGVDGRYMVTDMIGVGLFLRYNGASGTVTLPQGGADVDLDLGGFQVGVGARLRF